MRIGLPSLGKRGTSGSAALQFAIIAPVFFMMLFATLETAMVFYAEMILENAVKITGRTIRTGQAQLANKTPGQFRQDICDQVSFLLSCAADHLYVDVRSFGNFGAADFPPPLDANGNIVANLNNYQPGGSSQVPGQNSIVLVRVFYTWQLNTPMFSNYFSNMAGNMRLITSSMAFKNEPY
jgi:Flp pilus assembly protein TadG